MHNIMLIVYRYIGHANVNHYDQIAITSYTAKHLCYNYEMHHRILVLK